MFKVGIDIVILMPYTWNMNVDFNPSPTSTITLLEALNVAQEALVNTAGDNDDGDPSIDLAMAAKIREHITWLETSPLRPHTDVVEKILAIRQGQI